MPVQRDRLLQYFRLPNIYFYRTIPHNSPQQVIVRNRLWIAGLTLASTPPWRVSRSRDTWQLRLGANCGVGVIVSLLLSDEAGVGLGGHAGDELYLALGPDPAGSAGFGAMIAAVIEQWFPMRTLVWIREFAPVI